jgi:hypothetical protein
MGFVTAGLGNSGNLVTVGLGLTTIIIVTPPDDTVQGATTYNEYHKKRVKGLHLKNDNGTVILQTLTAKSEMPLKMFQYLKISEKDQSKILQKIEKQLDNKTDFGVLVIRKSSSSVTLKQHFIRKIEQKTGFRGERLLNFLEKQTKIKEQKRNKTDTETKHINVTDTIDNIEVAELLDILKDLEDSDV